MAKTALKQKAARKPKYGVRAYTRCNRCGRPHSVYRKFGLCPSAFVRWHWQANFQASQSPAGKHYVVGPQGKPRRGRAKAQCQ